MTQWGVRWPLAWRANSAGTIGRGVLAGTAFAIMGAEPGAAHDFLPGGGFDPALVGGLHQRLDADPRDVRAACELVRLHLDEHRIGADNSRIGNAWSLLAPWENEPSPPADVRLARAALRQRVHEFEAALAELAPVLEADPRQAQAWLMRTTILEVLGRYHEARIAAMRLGTLTSPLIALACQCSLASRSGNASESYDALRNALEATRAVKPGERLWATTVLAEMAERLDRPGEAEAHHRSALALEPTDPFLLAAFADFLIDQSRFGEAESLVTLHVRHAGLRLRRLLATRAHALAGPAASPQAREGADRPAFEASDADLLRRFFADGREGRGGAHPHLREEAIFVLRIENDPGRACDLALANWTAQREPVDARLVLECALAADRPMAARPVREWLAHTGLESARIRALSDRLDRALVAAPSQAPSPPVLQRLESDGLTIECQPDLLSVAARLHAGLVAENRGSDDDALAAINANRGAALGFLAGRLGLDEAPSISGQLFDDLIPMMERATSFPDHRRVQIWDKLSLQLFLEAGGQLPGLVFDRARNRFLLQRTLENRGPQESPPAVPVPVFVEGAASPGLMVDGLRRQIGELRALRRESRRVHAGMVLHECAEATLVRVIGLDGAHRRWFCEGFANALAADALRNVAGTDAAASFLAVYDPKPHRHLAAKVRLPDWQPADQAGPLQDDECRRLDQARYAFATDIALRFGQSHPPDVIPRLFRQLREKKIRDLDGIRRTVREITGSDLPEVAAD